MLCVWCGVKIKMKAAVGGIRATGTMEILEVLLNILTKVMLAH